MKKSLTELLQEKDEKEKEEKKPLIEREATIQELERAFRLRGRPLFGPNVNRR